MKYIIILGLLLGIFKQDHSTIARKVAYAFQKNYAPHELHIFAYGGGMMSGIERYNICFQSNKIVEIAEARKMIVDLTEKFLTYVNHSEARPYFTKFPYDESDLTLAISYMRNNNFVQGSIAYVSMYNGNLCYSIDSPKLLQEVHKESYSEAYEIVTGKPFKDRKIIAMDSQQ